MKNIIVLGAGTAGLITSLIIKKTFRKYNITVIESDSIGIIGVGEGSTEHWRMFSQFCEIDVARSVRETDSALKKGIKFENWNGDGKSYFHAISGPFFRDAYSAYPLDLSEKLTFLKTLIANNISLYDVLNGTNLIHYNSGINFVNQYHFNTFKLNKFLHTVCEENDIKFIHTTVDSVQVDEGGNVKSLTDNGGNVYSADFFIDSSGFKRVISTALGVKWISYKKYLPMNHALAFPTNDVSDLKPYTLSRALSSGWNWRISTQGRYGNGYVFCDDFITADKAHEEIQSFYSEPVNVAKDIKFEAGSVDKYWVKNCLSVGLSASFVEPLEATSIGNSILQAFGFVKMLSSWESDPTISEQYNKQFTSCFNNIVDFVQLHYFTKRKDSPFWRSIQDMIVKTDFNNEHLERFKRSLPNSTYFYNNIFNMFSANNFTQVMDGLDLFDRDYIRTHLATTYSDKLVQQELNKYNNYLDELKKASYIDHKVLLEQNNIVVNLDYK